MTLHPRFDEPPVVLLAAALLVVIPATTLQVGGTAGVALAAGAVAFGGGLLAWRLRLASPAVVAVATVGVVGASTTDSSLPVVAALPVLAAVAALEYALRRLAGSVPIRLSHDTEVAVAWGALAGLAWAAVVHVLLPASDDFGVVVRDVGPDGLVEPLGSLVYAVAGPVLVVGLAVALFARFRLATPLGFAGLEVGSFLAGSGGDSVGSLASLLWVVGVPLLLAVAAAELWLRTEGLPYARTKLSGS